MPIPGVNSILFQVGSSVWPNETPPNSELAANFEAIPEYLSLGRNAQALEALNALNAIRSQLQPSQEMRFTYLMGMYLQAKDEKNHAVAFFEQALFIAETHNDLASRCELTLRIGHIAFYNQLHTEALAHYQIAYGLWEKLIQDQSPRRKDAEVMLKTYIGSEQWSIGEINNAHDTLGSAISIAEMARATERTETLENGHANALWILGLTFRAISDMRDGDKGYLRDAIERFHKAIALYKEIGSEDHQVGRISIQIAEAYLDLTELHLSNDKSESARAMRAQANAYINQAADFLLPADDPEGRILARITQLRIKLTRKNTPKTAREYHEINQAFAAIEQDHITQNDVSLMAKSLTLRAEWLIKLGDVTGGCEFLRMAQRFFGSEGKGMATRAERLYRTYCKPANPENKSDNSANSYGPETYSPN